MILKSKSYQKNDTKKSEPSESDTISFGNLDGTKKSCMLEKSCKLKTIKKKCKKDDTKKNDTHKAKVIQK